MTKIAADKIATVRIRIRTSWPMQADERKKSLKTMDVEWMLEQLWSPIVAITAAHNGRSNGLISSTAVTASLLPEAPRLTVQLARASLTRELALAANAFAVHLLPANERGLELFRALGFRTGREAAKLDDVATKLGTLGAPILADAVAYAEAQVAETLETGEMTIVVADVVAGTRLSAAPVLTIEYVRERLPADWLAEWEARREREVEDARRFRR